MAEDVKPITPADFAAIINGSLAQSDGDAARAYAISVTATSILGRELGKSERQRMYDHMSVQEAVNQLELHLGLDVGADTLGDIKSERDESGN